MRSDKYVRSLSAELILSLIYMCILLCGLVNMYIFLDNQIILYWCPLVFALRNIHMRFFGVVFYAYLWYWKDNMT